MGDAERMMRGGHERLGTGANKRAGENNNIYNERLQPAGRTNVLG